jgi:small subunit ribosomal protein S17
METKQAIRRSRIGRVISDNTPKTIKIRVEGLHKHPQYKKYVKDFSTFMVHDPEDACHLGDLVRIEECRPMSKSKKWIVCEIVEKASGAAAAADKKVTKEATE